MPGTFRSKPLRGSVSSRDDAGDAQPARLPDAGGPAGQVGLARSLDEVRAGVDPATIIDPETGRPINPEEGVSPARQSPPRMRPIPLLKRRRRRLPPSQRLRRLRGVRFRKGLPEELKQMYLLVGEAYHRKPESSGEETPTSRGR